MFRLNMHCARTMATHPPGSERKKDWVFNELLSRLVAGRYGFGAKISAKDLSEEMGVSRFPVMGALNDLRHAGFIIVTAQVGCEVISPSAVQIHDFFLLFGRMEGIMAELAAERRLSEEVGRMRSINERIATISSSAGAGEEYRQLNLELHGLIHTAARSPLLHARQVTNWAMSDFLITQAGGFERRFREATKEHADVIDRIERKAASRARLAMETHIQNFARAVRDLLNARSGQRERSPLKNTRHTG